MQRITRSRQAAMRDNGTSAKDIHKQQLGTASSTSKQMLRRKAEKQAPSKRTARGSTHMEQEPSSKRNKKAAGTGRTQKPQENKKKQRTLQRTRRRNQERSGVLLQKRQGEIDASTKQKTETPAAVENYSSPTPFDRAFILNPAIPQVSVTSANTFSIVSYNILAECHRVRWDYSYTPARFLGQDYRHKLLMKELQYLNGDIVCLQEVNPAYFNQTLLPEMEKLGYKGLMMKRTKADMDEGEATFYKAEAFDLETSEGVSLTEVAHRRIEAIGMRDDVVTAAAKAYMDRPDVVLITRLYCKAAKKSVTVGNVHVIYGDFETPDVQCLQASCAIEELIRVAGGENAPHVLCGDFNGTPFSPVYALVAKQELSVEKLQTVEGLQMDGDHGAHSLMGQERRLFPHPSSSLTSAYKVVNDQEPEVTCFTDDSWTLDYIFYSSHTLAGVGVLGVVNTAVIAATGGLPSKDFPSDHLSLKAVLFFRD